jgi:hypothetical protein
MAGAVACLAMAPAEPLEFRNTFHFFQNKLIALFEFRMIRPCD